MRDALVYYISRNAPFLESIFDPPFHTHQGWTALLDGQLRGGVSRILQQINSGIPATPATFQALYIACWIHQPVEKGSYMLSLQGLFMPLVKSAWDSLAFRWTSHLSETGRSAGEGYHFLKGYSELLVQLETDPGSRTAYLFLKTEGHGAFSAAHISSFFNKLKTGKGNTQSEALHHFAQEGTLGITERAAENYSNEYAALLKNLDIKGKVATAEEVIPAILSKLERKAPLVNGNQWAVWKARWQRIPGMRMANAHIADLIDNVIIPTANQPGLDGRHLGVLRSAVPALRMMSINLRRDAQNFGEAQVPRVFEEVRVTPAMVDASLRDFRQQLAAEVARARVAAAGGGAIAQ